MANFKVTDSPKNISLNDIRAQIDAFGGLAKNCRFAVRIVPAGTNNYLTYNKYGPFMRDLIYLAEGVQYPGRGFATDDAKYYGPLRSFPIRSEYEPINITFIMRSKGFEREFFDDWMQIINPISSFDFRYKKTYIATITIFQLAEYSSTKDPNNPVAEYSWSLQEAFPIAVQPIDLNWGDESVTRLTVSFQYRYWKRDNKDSSNYNFGDLIQGSINQ